MCRTLCLLPALSVCALHTSTLLASLVAYFGYEPTFWCAFPLIVLLGSFSNPYSSPTLVDLIIFPSWPPQNVSLYFFIFKVDFFFGVVNTKSLRKLYTVCAEFRCHSIWNLVVPSHEFYQNNLKKIKAFFLTTLTRKWASREGRFNPEKYEEDNVYFINIM